MILKKYNHSRFIFFQRDNPFGDRTIYHSGSLCWADSLPSSQPVSQEYLPVCYGQAGHGSVVCCISSRPWVSGLLYMSSKPWVNRLLYVKQGMGLWFVVCKAGHGSVVCCISSRSWVNRLFYVKQVMGQWFVVYQADSGSVVCCM